MLSAIVMLSLFLSVIWILILYKLDKHKKEPLGILLKLFIFGLLIGLPAGIINDTNEYLFGLFLMLFFVGFVEEGLKFLATYFGAYNSKDFDEPIDGVIYASVVALGFAFGENIDYLIFFLGSGSDLEIVLLRGTTAYLHVIFASIWGLQLGYYKHKMVSSNKLFLWFFLSALGHSLYDISVTYINPIFVLITVIIGSIFLMKTIIHLNRISPFNEIVSNIYCFNCGSTIKGNSVYCGHCGNKL